MLSSGEPNTAHLDFLLRHSVKMLNIYYHLVTNQRPPTAGSQSGSSSSKQPKSELFAREQPAATLQALGYFAGDYVYMKLYNILRGANDSYKVSQTTDSQIPSREPPLSRCWRRNGKSCAARALRFPSIQHHRIRFEMELLMEMELQLDARTAQCAVLYATLSNAAAAMAMSCKNSARDEMQPT